MNNIVENILENIYRFETEQQKIVAWVSQLEMQRIGLLTFAKSLPENVFPNAAKEKLINKIVQMEMMVDLVKPKENEVLESKRIKRCRYNNAGFCKMGTECLFHHSEEICEQYLMDGKCSRGKLCFNRHPKECKFWLGDPRGCYRGQACKYLHKVQNKGKKIIELKNKNDVHDIKTDIGKSKTILKKKSDKVEEISCTASTESDKCNECADESPCVPCIMEKWKKGEDEDSDESEIMDEIHVDRNNDCKECSKHSECVGCIMKKVQSDDFMDNSM